MYSFFNPCCSKNGPSRCLPEATRGAPTPTPTPRRPPPSASPTAAAVLSTGCGGSQWQHRTTGALASSSSLPLSFLHLLPTPPPLWSLLRFVGGTRLLGAGFDPDAVPCPGDTPPRSAPASVLGPPLGPTLDLGRVGPGGVGPSLRAVATGILRHSPPTRARPQSSRFFSGSSRPGHP
jgi:hypothetical protein